MKYSKFVVAILIALTASSALAGTGKVNIYGAVSMSLDVIDNGSGPTPASQGTRGIKISSNASRIGFRGNENVGAGYSVEWQIESLVNMDGSGTSSFATRNTYLGMKGNFGKLVAGRYDSPYKIVTRKLDVFGLVLADNRSLMGGIAGKSAYIQFDGRRTNAMVYQSPDMGGLSVKASYEAGAESATQSGEVKGVAWSVAGMYRQKGLYLALAYSTHKLGSPATGTLAGVGIPGNFAAAGSHESALKLGMGYTLDNLTFSLVQEYTRDSLGGAGAAAPIAGCSAVGTNCYGHHATYLAARYGLEGNSIELAFTRAGRLAGALPGSDTRASQISFGVAHDLSASTRVFALYTRLRNGADIDYSLAAASWTTGATAAAGNGAALKGVSLGLKHGF